jgi:hypothetical protein
VIILVQKIYEVYKGTPDPNQYINVIKNVVENNRVKIHKFGIRSDKKLGKNKA